MGKKIDLAIVTIMKNEAPYVKEWLDYHMLVGVKKFYIYDELVADTQLGSSGLKQGGQIAPAVGKTVGELKSIVSLDTFHADTSAGVPLEQLFQKIC